MNVTVSIIQFQPVLGKPEENARLLEPLFNTIGDSRLVVLPELSNSGYNFSGFSEAYQNSEMIGMGGVFQDFLIEKAKSKNIFIVSGINEREGDELFNSAILVGPEGIMGKYRKVHLFMNEKDIFQPGNAGFPVFDLGGFRIGIMICFDYLFPEPWRIMAQNGADMICHPSNLLTENPRKCLPGLGLMNRIYIATANRIGTEGNITFNGCSMFTDPSGKIFRTASQDRTEIISAEMDTEISRNKMITNRNHVFDDRLPGLYIS
jgi:predicted amidohydrolase